MHLFLKFIFGIKLYMFRTVPLSIIRSFSLYTQQWYMSYRFADSLRAGSGRSSVVWFIISAFLKAIIPLTYLVNIYNSLLYRIFTVITIIINSPLQKRFVDGRGVCTCRKRRQIVFAQNMKIIFFVDGYCILWAAAPYDSFLFP